MNNICPNFLSDVKREFRYLISNDYEIVHTESSTRDRCLIILKSDKLQVKLYRARDEVNLSVGNLSAPWTWGNKQDGKKQWFYLPEITGFLDHDLDVSVRSQNKSENHSNQKQQLINLSRLFKEKLPEIENLFSISEYDHFVVDISEFWKEYNRLYEIQYRKSLESNAG